MAQSLNLVYIGPEHILHLRRDMLMFFKYNLEEYGCDVTITYNNVIPGKLNILFGTTEMSVESMQNMNVDYIVFDLEVITGNTVNNRLGFDMEAYLEFLNRAKLVLTGLEDNRKYFASHGIKCLLQNPGYTEKLEEIEHKEDKDIDVYFFGIMSEYRHRILKALSNAGLNVIVSGYNASPYFIRNSFIERSKIVANITQDKCYNHINGLRVLYLAINGCCTVCERFLPITNGFGNLQYSTDNFVKECKRIIKNNEYMEMGEGFREQAKKLKPDYEEFMDFLGKKLFFGPHYREVEWTYSK